MIIHWSGYVIKPPQGGGQVGQNGIIVLPPRVPVSDKGTPPPAPKPKKVAPYEPTLSELATNFAGAMKRWAASGFEVATEEDYRKRSAICEACEFWDGKARGGLGKCNVRGCGCTKLKRYLGSEKCPLGKW
jgi:hypothetical protein